MDEPFLGKDIPTRRILKLMISAWEDETILMYHQLNEIKLYRSGCYSQVRPYKMDIYMDELRNRKNLTGL